MAIDSTANEILLQIILTQFYAYTLFKLAFRLRVCYNTLLFSRKIHFLTMYQDFMFILTYLTFFPRFVIISKLIKIGIIILIAYGYIINIY